MLGCGKGQGRRPRNQGYVYCSSHSAPPHAALDSRTLLNASYRSLLRTYILSPPNERPPDALVALLSSPRIRLVDLSYLDDSTGTTLLHEAARRRDLRMVELAVRAGADVFVRDRKGRAVTDGLSKDNRVRVFLRQCKTSMYIRSRTIMLTVLQLRIRIQHYWTSRLQNLPSSKGI